VSNARGEFTIENVTPKYDLVVLPNSSKGAPHTHVYVGLTTRRPSPRITVNDTFLRAAVSGSVSPALQQGERLGIGFKTPGQDAVGSVVLESGESKFGPFDVDWTSGTTIAGEIFALRWSVGMEGNVTGYRGWVSQSKSLSSGVPASIDLALGTISHREISGTVRFPQGTTFLSVGFAVEGLRVFDSFVSTAAAATSVPYACPVPVGLGSAARILSFRGAVGPDLSLAESRAKVSDTAATIDFELPMEPSLALPVDKASSVDSNTEFVWTPVSNAIYRLAIASDTTGGGYLVHTASTNGKIPDLTSKGVPLVPGAHQWAVEALGPADKIDAYVSSTSIIEERGRDFSVSSASRAFTARSQ
jgi:hypothetical protein